MVSPEQLLAAIRSATKLDECCTDEITRMAIVFYTMEFEKRPLCEFLAFIGLLMHTAAEKIDL